MLNHYILQRLLWVIFILSIVYFSIVNLESVPPLAWDEGWTLSVARNWVERGIYGRLLMGKPAPPGLEASLTVTAPAAFAFRLLGVGIWQGRIVGLFFLAGAITFIYFLSGRLYGRKVANIAFAALFLTATIFPHLHPILVARRVMAEVPMLFFVLGGYVCLFFVFARSVWFMPLAVVLWAIGALTKVQAFPFVAASLVLPLALTIWSRQWKFAKPLAAGFVSYLVTTRVLFWLQDLMFEAPRSPIPGIYGVVAFVPILEIRWLALQVSLFLLPTILGLLYETRKLLNRNHWSRMESNVDVLRVTVLGFTGSWLAWYIFSSNAYPRYAFPPSFVGSIFVAKLLCDLIDSNVEVFSWQRASKPNTMKFLQSRVSPELSLALVIIIVWSFSTLEMLYRAYVVDRDDSVKQVAQFLNTQTRPDALIETYDSELHILLNRPYHFPPDPVHLDLIRRTFPGNFTKVRINYDPLAADPDYLVVGDFIKGLRLYDPVLRTDAFHLIRSYNQYDIYKRTR